MDFLCFFRILLHRAGVCVYGAKRNRNGVYRGVRIIGTQVEKRGEKRHGEFFGYEAENKIRINQFTSDKK